MGVTETQRDEIGAWCDACAGAMEANIWKYCGVATFGLAEHESAMRAELLKSRLETSKGSL